MYYLVKPDGQDLQGPYDKEDQARGIQKALGLFGWDIFEIRLPEPQSKRKPA